MDNHYRTVWLSDIHLGFKDCKAEYLLDFLKNNRIDTLYLVGDIVDMWEMSRRFLWPTSHNQLFHKLINLPSEGVKVIYLPGNHDEPVKKYDGMMFSDIEIHREYIHTTADNKKLLVLHGDTFDDDVHFGAFHLWIGDKAYAFLLFLNRWYNRIRAALGFPYWSFAGYIKSRVKGANEAIARYKKACCKYAKEKGVDGVVCGHIHHPEVDVLDDVHYYNDGDWIENCSALTESHKGELALLYWSEIKSDNLYSLKNKRSEKKAA